MHHPARGPYLWSFQGKTHILHLSWCAFFLSFVWLAPRFGLVALMRPLGSCE